MAKHLYYAASYEGYLRVTEQLLQEKEADPNIPDTDERTPLFHPSSEGDSKIVQQLHQAHADPNIKDTKGVTPLHA